MINFAFVLQRHSMDCGPTCLAMICKHYGRSFNIEKLRELTEIGKDGVNVLGISDAAEKVGFRTQALQASMQELENDIQLPAILHWGQNHFVVLYRVKWGSFYIADPAKSLLKLKEKDVEEKWLSLKEDDGENTGILLTLEPTPDFYNNQYSDDYTRETSRGFSHVLTYLYPYKKLIIQLMVGLLVGSLLQLILPFLTQSIVDVGINTGNLSFIYIILFAQLALFAGRLSVDFIRSWILFHVSSRINISILTDFFIKLMKLPVSYFDSKQTGDILQIK